MNKLAWSPNGTRIASHSRELQIWDVQLGRLLYTYTYPGYYSGSGPGCGQLAWSPNGWYIASLGHPYDDRGKVWVWDIDIGKVICTYGGSKGKEISTIAWSPDSQYIASTADSLVFVWEVSRDFKFRRTIRTYHHPGVRKIAWSPDGQYIVSLNETMQIWNVSTGATLVTSKGLVYASLAAWSPDGKLIALASHEKLQVWDVAAGAILSKYLRYDGGAMIEALAWLPDSRRLALAGSDAVIQTWQVI